MNKKSIILTIFACIGLLIFSLAIYTSNQNLKKVTLNSTTEVKTINIYKNPTDKDPYKTLTTEGGTAKTKLKPGVYYYQCSGENIATGLNQLTIPEDDTTIQVAESYTDEHLSKLLETDYPKIYEAILDKYPEINSSYDIKSGRLFNKGEWFGAVVKQKTDARDITDLYRIVVYREKGEWRVVNRPEIILTTKEFPKVPKNILSSINSIAE